MSGTVSPLERALTVGATFGAAGLRRRLVHETRRRLNLFAADSGVTAAPGHLAAFEIDRHRLAAAAPRSVALQRAERVVAGEHEAYRWDWRPLPRSADEWVRHPSSHERWWPDHGWWRVPHLSRSHGDIKDLWEPARFAWMYDLVRGHLLTDDDRYAAAAVRYLTTWAASSPSFRGPHWSCGQETAIRAAALLYAEANFRGSPAWQAVAPLVATTLARSGERIATAIGYALSQRNNHGISEAVGLVLLGTRFRHALPTAARWLNTGRRLLAELVDEQFADDGWYIQHSFTYMRLALDQCVLASRVLRSDGGLDGRIVTRMRSAASLLTAVMDRDGCVPNHGANDGAYVHPITCAGVSDFRPVLTAVCAVAGIPLPATVAPEREAVAWLGIEPPATGAPVVDGVHTGPSGWAVARRGNLVAFFRAGRYRSRPGHIDPLHLEIRVGGTIVLADAGTFAYGRPDPWNNGLAGEEVHNGPQIAGRPAAIRGPRFLWYRWPSARVVTCGVDGTTMILRGERTGVVTRTVHLGEDMVSVVDEVPPGVTPRLRVRWLLGPSVPPATVRSDIGSEVIVAREGSVVGWISSRYGERVPSRVVQLERDAKDGASIRSCIDLRGWS
jgi:hypothetical protein